MKKNTIFTAIKKHAVNRLNELRKSPPKEKKLKTEKKEKSFSSSENKLKQPSAPKTTETSTIKETTKLLFRDLGQIKIENIKYYAMALFCIIFILITTIVGITSILKQSLESNIYRYDNPSYTSEQYASILDRNIRDLIYNGKLEDGEKNLVQTKNISATNSFDSDFYLVRKRQLQYDSFKQNNSDILLSWIIQNNTQYLFPNYDSLEITRMLDSLTEYIYHEILFKYLRSNAIPITNFFRSYGYKDRDDFVAKVIKPKAYIYLYLITRIAKTDKNDERLKDFSIDKIMENNVFRKVWAIKFAKNYTKYENSSNPICNNLDAITDSNPPTSYEWLKITSCNLINEDVIFGKRSLALDEDTGKTYSGYLGVLTNNDPGWFRFCDFISAQICYDEKYNANSPLLKSAFNLFLETISSERTNSSVVNANLVDLEFLDSGDAEAKTILFPFENSYVIVKTNNITAIDLVINKKLNPEDNIGIQALASFITGSFNTKGYAVFCNSHVANDFSWQSASDKLDVETSVFDSYSINILNNLCSAGVSI